MSDGVELCQQCFDAKTLSSDAPESGHERGVLLWKHRAQVEQDAIFFDAGDDRWF
jgi:hypothetical protein